MISDIALKLLYDDFELIVLYFKQFAKYFALLGRIRFQSFLEDFWYSSSERQMFLAVIFVTTLVKNVTASSRNDVRQSGLLVSKNRLKGLMIWPSSQNDYFYCQYL